MFKRLFDCCASLFGIVILLPAFLLIAVWIKLDSPGYVFFRQTRVGQFGKEFQIYKFRTMVTAAEDFGDQLTVAQDQRITRCGKFLRHFKLDELPQLFNVVKGDMSLVGPRPEVPKYVELYSLEQFRVLVVRPGITDLASIEFRNESELLAQFVDPEQAYIHEIMPKKLALSMQYIDHASFVEDLKIILQTLRAIVADS
jgi:lipopolysaccharide/colanic/teichoic acid biosynthesis glycosyltransferase